MVILTCGLDHHHDHHYHHHHHHDHHHHHNHHDHHYHHHHHHDHHHNDPQEVTVVVPAHWRDARCRVQLSEPVAGVAYQVIWIF